MELKIELFKEVDDLFKFVVMLQIFFISIIDLFFKFANNTVEQLSKTELEYGVIIAVFGILFIIYDFW